MKDEITIYLKLRWKNGSIFSTHISRRE